MKPFDIHIAVALGLCVVAAGCRASRQLHSESRSIEKVHISSKDSLLRLAVAHFDEPEIVIVDIDSPRRYVRMVARKADISTKVKENSYAESRAETSADEIRETDAHAGVAATGTLSWWIMALAVAVGAVFGSKLASFLRK